MLNAVDCVTPTALAMRLTCSESLIIYTTSLADGAHTALRASNTFLIADDDKWPYLTHNRAGESTTELRYERTP